MLTIQRSNLKCIIKTSNSSSYTGFRPNEANESPRTVFWVCCKNINEQKNIKRLEIPSQLKLNLFRVWKQYQMEREEIKQHRGRVERELPLRRGDYHRLVITYYSYKDRSPRIPGQGDFTTDTDYSYYFHWTKELNLSFKERTYSYDFSSVGVIRMMVGSPGFLVIVITVWSHYMKLS